MNDNLSDEELMVMYQNGTEEAFSMLYKRHSSKIYGYVRSKIRTDEKARDIFQEIYIKIHRSKNLYNKMFPVLPWFFTIARSVLIDEVRKEQTVKLVPQETIDVAGNEEARPSFDISPGLNALPESQRAAVHLRYIDEKTFEEIADHLETSPDNVRQLVSRGVKKLRQILKPGGAE
jgi:RNA polymerase sigma factor (sigma-70 family)